MKRHTLFLLFLIVSFLFLRLFHLSESLNFGSDQGFGILEIRRLYETRAVTLLGPASSLTAQGHSLYASSLIYYLTLGILLLFGWNPLGISYALITFQLLALLFAYRMLQKQFPASLLPMIFAILCTAFPAMVTYAQFSWAPNYLIPLSLIILGLLFYRAPLLIGFLLGIGLALHYSFFLTGVVVLLWIGIRWQHQRRAFFPLAIGFLLGFSPLLLFELRHNFYNLRTLLFVLSARAEVGSISGTLFHFHYILSLLPFLLFFCASVLAGFFKKHKYLVVLILFFFLGYSFSTILPVPRQGFTMPEGWNYPGLLQVRDRILSTGEREYNIVDILSGDTRAYALRALLTLAGRPPQDVTEYPSATALFVYTREPIDTILSSSLWEIAAARPLFVKETWHIQNGIFLYVLEKKKEE